MAEKRIMMRKYFCVNIMVDSNSNRQSSLIANEPKRDEMYQKTQHTVNNVHPLQGTRGCFFFYLQPRLWKCRWVKDLKDEGGYEEKEPLSPQDHLNILMEEGAGAQVSPWPLWQKRRGEGNLKRRFLKTPELRVHKKIPQCCISWEGLRCPQRANVFFSIAQHPPKSTIVILYTTS